MDHTLSTFEVNRQLALEVHTKKLKQWRSKPLRRPDKYLDRFYYAVAKVRVNIRTTDSEAIKTDIEDLGLEMAARFETVRVVNELLKYLNKLPIKNPVPRQPDEVTYIPIAQFLEKIKNMPMEHSLYLASLYAAGCRFGELPTLTLKGDWAFIARQLFEDGKTGLTKNGKQRHSAILPILRPMLEQFKALPEQVQADLRLNDYNKMYKASVKNLKVSIHTIRHSYAIECAKAGKSVEEIASWIGDTVTVTRKHYLGYIQPVGSPW